MQKKKKIIIKKADQELLNYTKKICKIIHKTNKNFIEKWLNIKLNNHLSSIIEDAVVKEFRSEVVPLILTEIDSKVKISSENIQRKVIKEVKDQIATFLHSTACAIQQ